MSRRRAAADSVPPADAAPPATPAPDAAAPTLLAAAATVADATPAATPEATASASDAAKGAAPVVDPTAAPPQPPSLMLNAEPIRLTLADLLAAASEPDTAGAAAAPPGVSQFVVSAPPFASALPFDLAARQRRRVELPERPG